MADEQRWSCRRCDRTDLSLTKNGRVRSHAANGKKVDPYDNPACPGGSDLPRETEAPTGEPQADPNPHRKPLEPDHRHQYVWADDGAGHSGSFCSCGKEEPAELPHERYVPEPRENDPATAARNGHKTHTLAAGDHNYGGPAVTATIPAEEAEPRVPEQKLPPGAAADEADDFLGAGGEAEAGSGGGKGPWFRSRYDGDCATCGRMFFEGDEIRADGSGGWEGQDCCGAEDADDSPATARKVADAPVHKAPTLPVRNGRYAGPDPETGKATKWTRTTTWASTLSDSIALDQWKARMAVLGLVVRPDLFEKAKSALQGHTPSKPYDVARLERDLLNGIVEDAKLAAGSKDRANKGTILHKHTEEIESARRALADVPEEFRGTVAAYLACLEKYGLQPVKGLIERSTLATEIQVVGTFDRVLLATRDVDIPLKEGKKIRMVRLLAGQCVIGDVKSGDNLEFPWLEILIQLSIYAHGVNDAGVAVPDDNDDGKVYWRWAPLKEFGVDKVREDIGIVMHIPYGEDVCHLHGADLVQGWRGAKLCGIVRDWRKLDLLGEPFGSAFAPAAVPAPLPAPESPAVYHAPAGDHEDAEMLPVSEKPVDWDATFQAVRTRDEGNQAWADAKAAGLPEDRIKELIGMAKLGEEYRRRASEVTTQAEASALWEEIRAHVGQVGMTRMAECVKIMQDRLTRGGN